MLAASTNNYSGTPSLFLLSLLSTTTRQNGRTHIDVKLSKTWDLTLDVRPGWDLIFSCDGQLKKWRCHSVRSFVCHKEVFFKSKWKGSFKGVSRKFQESFKGLVREFWVSFKGISKKFWEWFTEVLELFIWSFHSVFRKFQGWCKKSSVWKFKGCVESIKRFFKKLSGVFQGVWSKLQRSVSKKLLKCMEI